MRFSLSAVFVMLLFGCQPQRDLLNSKETHGLIVSSQLRLPLDSLSGDRIPSIQLINSQSQKLLYLNDKGSHCINIYDFHKRKLIKKIQLSPDGPNGISGNKLGMFVHTPDSIFIHSTTIPKIYLIDRNGNLLSVFDLVDKSTNLKLGFNSYPIVTTSFPSHVKKDTLYMNTYNIDPVKDHTRIFTCLALNIKTGGIRYKFPRPSYYNAGNWGFSSFRTKHTLVYVPEEDLTIISHGNSHRLMIVDKDNSIKEVSAGSDFIDKIEPISNNMNDFISEEETREFESRTGIYGGILYNSKEGVYYRIAILPIPESKSTQIKLWELKSMIILDRAFNKIGEQIIPTGYNFAMHFIDDGSLYVFNQKKFDASNGDSLIFDAFNLIRKTEK
jgi:Domain of unknown function (DUF4221)